MPGSIIKKKRELLGITQLEMAEKLFMSQSAYSRIENKQHSLRMDIAKKIASILGCGMDELLPDHVWIENVQMPDDGELSLYDQEVYLKLERMLDSKIEDLKVWLKCHLENKVA